MSGAALVAHSGGPTTVINASLVGIVEEARRHPEISSLLGARFGVEGVLSESWVDLFAVEAQRLSAIGRAPASALGTSRLAVTREDLERVLDVCRARGVRFLFYTGGNGSMVTAHDLATLARDKGHALTVIGVPKTIDNDLFGTRCASRCPRLVARGPRELNRTSAAPLVGPLETYESLA